MEIWAGFKHLKPECALRSFFLSDQIHECGPQSTAYSLCFELKNMYDFTTYHRVPILHRDIIIACLYEIAHPPIA